MTRDERFDAGLCKMTLQQNLTALRRRESADPVADRRQALGMPCGKQPGTNSDCGVRLVALARVLGASAARQAFYAEALPGSSSSSINGADHGG